MINQVIKSLKAFLEKVNPENWKAWLWYFLFVAFFHLVFYQVFVLQRKDGKWYSTEGDPSQYIGSVENLLEGKDYTFFRTDQNLFVSNFVEKGDYDLGVYYAFRTPGFAFFYYPLRLVLNYHAALTAIVFFQAFLSGIALYLLCLLFFRIKKSKGLFIVMSIFALVAFPLTFWNNHIMTDSMGVSFLILGFFFLKSGVDLRNLKTLFFSGFLFTMAIYFRPFLALVFIPTIWIVWKSFPNHFMKPLIIFFSAFFIIHPLWVARNYYKTGKIIPLATTMDWLEYTHRTFKENREICKQLSLSPLWWELQSPSYYLEEQNDSRNPIEVYGKEFFVSLEDINVVKQAKLEYHSSLDTSNSISLRRELEESSSKKLNELRQKHLEHHPWNFVVSRWKSLKDYLSPPLMKPFISIKYPLNVAAVGLESIVSKFIFAFGFVAVFLGIYRYRTNWMFLGMIFIALFVMFFFVNSRIIEHRFTYVPSYFFAFFGLDLLYHWIKSKKWIYISISLIGILSLVGHDLATKISW